MGCNKVTKFYLKRKGVLLKWRINFLRNVFSFLYIRHVGRKNKFQKNKDTQEGDRERIQGFCDNINNKTHPYTHFKILIKPFAMGCFALNSFPKMFAIVCANCC